MDDDPYDSDTGPVPVHLKTKEDWIVYIVLTLIVIIIAVLLGARL